MVKINTKRYSIILKSLDLYKQKLEKEYKEFCLQDNILELNFQQKIEVLEKYKEDIKEVDNSILEIRKIRRMFRDCLEE